MIFTTKNEQIYVCNTCDFKCSYYSDWSRHLSTRKHSVSLSGNPVEIKKTSYECKCGREYKTMSGLWKHKNTCIQYQNDLKKNPNINPNINTKNELEPTNNEIIEIMKIQMIENQELRKLMLEQQKQIFELATKTNSHTTNSNNISNNTINSNNNTFNLQFFLNETCKDALNIREFVDSIKIQLSDLETIGRVGYVEGVSKILIKNLNELDTCKRPIHCSDLKREVLYIKDDDKWLKENDEKLVIKKAIKDVANKNIKQIPEWMRRNPNCNSSDSTKNDQYLQIVMNSMSGSSNEEQYNNIEKIVKNITKSVIIEK